MAFDIAMSVNEAGKKAAIVIAALEGAVGADVARALQIATPTLSAFDARGDAWMVVDITENRYPEARHASSDLQRTT